MLDFYIISNEQPKPDWPEKVNLVLAGSMDSKLFHNLQKKGLIGERFDYYNDFR